MLVGFSVNNYQSFKDSQSISMIASKIVRHKEHTIIKGNQKLLKSAVIFGANAGGKSNFIKAVDFSRRIILNGIDNVNVEKKYFRISKDMYNSPGIFEYRMIINEIEYSYGLVLSYKTKEILGEWLIKIEKSGRETYIFNREIGEDGLNHVETEMKYDNQDDIRMQIYLEDFGEKISDVLKKKTILSDIAMRVGKKRGVFNDIVAVYEWFTNMLIIFPHSKYNGLNNVVADDEKRDFFESIMSFFDTGIEGIKSIEQEMDFDKIFQNIPGEEAEKIKIEISNNISNRPVMVRIQQKIYILKKGNNGNIVYYKMLLNHGNNEDLFEFIDESDGTRRLFDLIPILFLNRKKSVIFIDEIDRSLHTNLIRQFFQVFYRLSSEDTCQLIATTHDSNLLDLDLLRQDEIWFVERKDDHSSRIYSLSKFKERFDKKINRDYLLGRYGAIPIFDESLIDLEGLDEQ